ncbi:MULTISPECIES: hypothetical protein [Fischerella]|uniref:hypothetical protein n=1 Tax=Fischerella TaxID=1190 RepID=UPI000721DB29|nr:MULTISPECIES: hypothetical protein [Fischerella]BAU05719.1 hypothetical protein FIS3754_16260 [Fischerella sp. NIES-3754]BCX07991.1 MAG: hypothetical protein KatS3mg066_1850 [Fischerella sp.]
MNQTIDFDTNPTVAVSEYDNMARIALPGYEAMHIMVLACLRSHLPDIVASICLKIKIFVSLWWLIFILSTTKTQRHQLTYSP